MPCFCPATPCSIVATATVATTACVGREKRLNIVLKVLVRQNAINRRRRRNVCGVAAVPQTYQTLPNFTKKKL